jgi:hypothetical protein
MKRNRKQKHGTQSDNSTIMKRAYEYVLLIFNLIINTDNLF